MRYTIKTFFALAILIGVSCKLLIFIRAEVLEMSIRTTYDFEIARSDISSMKLVTSYFPSVTAEDLNVFFCQNENRDAGLPGELGRELAEYRDGDPWEGQYYAKSLVNDDQIHFYSKGKDRVTFSDGNDPDDISSWKVPLTKYYTDQFNRKVLKRYLVILAWGLLLFTCIIFAIKSRSKKN